MPVFKGAFSSDTDTTGGKRPVVFDVLGPDHKTSLLEDGLKLVLHVNPSSFGVQYTRTVERIQTWGGFVEQHWGDAATEMSINGATGGFLRMYAGLVGTSNPAYGGTRRETIAYDKYLDLLALYNNNGSVYDVSGQVILEGVIKITFDEGVYLGKFSTFSVSESEQTPYQFNLTAAFTVHKEIARWRSSS